MPRTKSQRESQVIRNNGAVSWKTPWLCSQQFSAMTISREGTGLEYDPPGSHKGERICSTFGLLLLLSNCYPVKPNRPPVNVFAGGHSAKHLAARRDEVRHENSKGRIHPGALFARANYTWRSRPWAAFCHGGSANPLRGTARSGTANHAAFARLSASQHAASHCASGFKGALPGLGRA